MGFLTGKRALIVGLASERSIAHGIAAAMHREGAELAFTYQNDRLKDRVLEMAQAFNSAITLPMDVASDAEIDAAFAGIRAVWDSLDIIVHSVAFAPREELAGTFVESTTRDGFRIAHEISSYSLTALAKAGKPLMQGRAGAIITLSYLGAVRSIPSYNVMGLRASGRLQPVRRADGGASVPETPCLPPMRGDEAGAGGLSRLWGRGADGGGRAGGGAAG